MTGFGEWAETRDLALSSSGRLYRFRWDDAGEYDGRDFLGVIDSYHSVPDELADQLAELLDRWVDTPSGAEQRREDGEGYRAGVA